MGHCLAPFACAENQPVLPALENQHVSDSKHCSPVDAMLYVSLIYLCVNSVLKFIFYREKIGKALNVFKFVTGVLLIIIAAFVHLKISNHMKSMCCTGIASLALSIIYFARCWKVGNRDGTVAGFVPTTIIAIQ